MVAAMIALWWSSAPHHSIGSTILVFLFVAFGEGFAAMRRAERNAANAELDRLYGFETPPKKPRREHRSRR